MYVRKNKEKNPEESEELFLAHKAKWKFPYKVRIPLQNIAFGK